MPMLTCICTAGAATLNIGNHSINLLTSCTSDHKLNVYDGTNTYCAEATTDTLTDALHVMHNGTSYSICNGACGGGGGEWVMPEEPEDPIVLPSSCTWTQTNENAYLLSDGNQYFDTKVPLNSRDDIEVTVKVQNGKSARLFGGLNTSCYYAMSLANNGSLATRFGYSGRSYTLTSEEQTGKTVYKTENTSNNKKIYYVNDRDLTNGGVSVNTCTNSDTMLVLNNNHPSVVTWSQSGGVKLYRIRMWNSSGTLIHDFQPVKAGTNICGTVAATNAMWDSVTKKLYYPAGTGQMGYGTDTQ